MQRIASDILFSFELNGMRKRLVIMVMGLPGSGKTFFARHLSHAIDAVYIGSDEVRRQLRFMGKYQNQYKFKVYGEMLEQAEKYLLKGSRVVLDATFYLKEMRLKVAELAKKQEAVLISILVEAEDSVIRERLSKPRADSEADWDVYQKLKGEFEPMEGLFLSLKSDNENIDTMLRQTIQYITLHYGKL
ncbi:AAA family ATPase [Cecembia calidifontis]|uniref:Kinase n=1 Tax=Cecembia calidifontis TaxID=1187080 RepID=A0A4Q7P866_9BACT|nr:AAA family ATPase [Cecembia calidifontis]RZS96294.1 hypothetical protein BC751_1861 [Cecembia calidifontis]